MLNPANACHTAFPKNSPKAARHVLYKPHPVPEILPDVYPQIAATARRLAPIEANLQALPEDSNSLRFAPDQVLLQLPDEETLRNFHLQEKRLLGDIE
jgi:hypothetical protein